MDNLWSGSQHAAPEQRQGGSLSQTSTGGSLSSSTSSPPGQSGRPIQGSPGGLQGVQGVPGTELRVPGPSATSRVAVCKESVSLLSGTRWFRGLLLELVAVCLSWLLTALSRVLWLSAWSATALHAVGGNSKLLRVVGPCFCFDTYNLDRQVEGRGGGSRYLDL